MRSTAQVDALWVGVLVGVTLAGLLVVWVSSAGVAVWFGLLTFGLAVVLVLEIAYLWDRLTWGARR